MGYMSLGRLLSRAHLRRGSNGSSHAPALAAVNCRRAPIACLEAQSDMAEALFPFANLASGSGMLALGAHRGMGANRWLGDGAPGHFAQRENTVKSFLRAVAHGASFVELDVQVTACGVPVVWHDDYVHFGHVAAPSSLRIAELTAEEFRRLDPASNSLRSFAAASAGYDSDGGSSAGVRGGSTDSLLSLASCASGRSGLLRKPRGDSPALPHEPGLANWDCAEEDGLPTLEEVLGSLPPRVGVNVEVKMTTPAHVPSTPDGEVLRMVDATLAVIARAGAGRPIVISSFDPEVCLEIKRRSTGCPVLFLSGGGAYEHVDPRRVSIPAAIDFASGAGLDGIVLETFQLQRQSHLVGAAAAAGLAVMTYGVLNDDVAWVEAQHALGVCGVIVDDVAGVAARLPSKIVLA